MRRQWVAGHIESEQFLFVSKAFVRGPLGNLLAVFLDVWARLFKHSEKRALSTLAVLRYAGAAREGVIDPRKQRRAGFTKAIACAGFNQCFKHFAVHGSR